MNTPLPGETLKPPSPTHLFLLRVWAEEMGYDQYEWRASVRHVLSGETRSIRTWHDLETFINMISSQQVILKGERGIEEEAFSEGKSPEGILTPNEETRK